MTLLAACPRCQRLLRAKARASASSAERAEGDTLPRPDQKYRCPACGTIFSSAALPWQRVEDVVAWEELAEEELTADATRRWTTVALDDETEAHVASLDEIQASDLADLHAMSEVHRAVSQEGRNDSLSSPAPGANDRITEMPGPGTGTGSFEYPLFPTSPPPRRGRPRSRSAVWEVAKIVGGACLGLLLAQLLLWWLPGEWRRDPLGLAAHVPEGLLFLLPQELRPVKLLVPTDGLPEVPLTGVPKPAPADTVAPGTDAPEGTKGAGAEGANPTGDEPSGQVNEPTSSLEVPAVELPADETNAPPRTPPSDTTALPPTGVEPSADSLAADPPAQPTPPVYRPSVDPTLTPPAPPRSVVRAPLTPSERSAQLHADSATRPVKIELPRVESAQGDRLARQLRSLQSLVDELGDVEKLPTDQRGERTREIYARLGKLGELLTRQTAPDVRWGQQMNDVEELLLRLSAQPKYVRWIGRTAPTWITYSGRRHSGIVLAGRVTEIARTTEGAVPEFRVVVEVPGGQGKTLTMRSRRDPASDPRMPYAVGDHLLALGLLSDARGERPIQLGIHVVCPRTESESR